MVGAVLLTALAGCAGQDPFRLPDLTPRGAGPGAQVYPSYGYDYGAGYPSRYQPGYGNGYGYANPWYSAQGPYPYGYGYAYNQYPRYILVPCADSNGDGRCDTRPPKKHHDRDQHGHDNGDHPVQPQHGDRGEVPRARDGNDRDVAPNAQRRAVPVPAPVLQQPAQVRPEPRRATLRRYRRPRVSEDLAWAADARPRPATTSCRRVQRKNLEPRGTSSSIMCR
ncbi:MAG: hypothetical protein NTU56_04770 [Proteobacteria bacterium]|nr:hypothetical protein [Pseudomonadota bacterium]